MTFEEWAQAHGISTENWERYEELRTVYEAGWQAREAYALWEETA
jgi:hypothetical protein